MTIGGDTPPPSIGGDGQLQNCSKFGECRCPQCNKFYFDSNSCEIVWRCHGCGTPYDPYTTDPKGPHGYRFTLKRKSLLTGEEHDYGQVKPRGRIAARDNTRYTLTATNEKCAIPRVYVVDSTPTCGCPRGCDARGYPVGEYGIVEDVRSEATLMLWDFTTTTVDFTDRGSVSSRKRTSFDGVNASHSFPIKRGSLGKYYIVGNNTSFLQTECKFHYVERFGTAFYRPPHNNIAIWAGGDVWLYDLGGVTTEYWWNLGGTDEIYVAANFRLKHICGWGIPYAPDTPNHPERVVEPPSPEIPVMRGGSIIAQIVDYTSAWLPEWVTIYSGSFPVPRWLPDGSQNPAYEVLPEGAAFFRQYPLGVLDPAFTAFVDNSQHWCNETARDLGIYGTDGHSRWESLFT